MMKFIKLTQRETRDLLINTLFVLFLIVIIVLLFNQWSVNDRLDAMERRLMDWQHLIDFLEQWVKQNNLTIKPPGTDA
jgi:hypothetical protein